MPLLRFVKRRFPIGLMFLGAGIAGAQDYPNKPIRIVTTAAGGGGAFTARQVAQGLSGPLGQPVIVDNRTSGFLAADVVYKAPADGYTLAVQGSAFWVTPLLRKLPYDVVKDFSPISLLVREVKVLAVHPAVPVKSVKELISLAKARPGELNFGTGAIGGAGHLATELFKAMAGVNIVHVPYKSTAASITAVLAGEVQILIVDVGLLVPHVTSGKLRALAITNTEPSALTPGLPTVAASGLPGYAAEFTTGIFAPAKTPETIIKRLNQEIVRSLGRPDVKEQFLNAQQEVVASSAEQFAATIKSDMATMDKVIKDTGIKLE